MSFGITKPLDIVFSARRAGSMQRQFRIASKLPNRLHAIQVPPSGSLGDIDSESPTARTFGGNAAGRVSSSSRFIPTRNPCSLGANVKVHIKIFRGRRPLVCSDGGTVLQGGR